jgi:hypothetical protein
VGQRLPRSRGLHLALATVFADVARLRKVGIMLSPLARGLLAIRAELAGRFPDLGGHIGVPRFRGCVYSAEARAGGFFDGQPAARFAAFRFTTL